MAYKYSKGVTYQGDIYDENDPQRNTYIDFGADDYIGLVASGSSVLVVSGSKVGIGTETPAYTLDVQGYISVGSAGTAYIINNNDTNTHIKLGGGGVPGLDGMTFTCGGKAMLTLDENGLDTVTVGTTGDATDFKVMTANTDYALYVSGGTDTVGIGTSTPTSTLSIEGSISTKISNFTGTSNTLDSASATALMGSDNSNCTVNLPAASGCTGRTYIFKRLAATDAGVSILITPNGSDNIDGNNTSSSIVTQYNTFALQSDGSNWWIISSHRQ
jgi:hypothetical protein